MIAAREQLEADIRPPGDRLQAALELELVAHGLSVAEREQHLDAPPREGVERLPQRTASPTSATETRSMPTRSPIERVLYGRSRSAGNRITSRIASCSLSTMARRSMPKPSPPVGGMP